MDKFTEDRINELREKKKAAKLGGGQKKLEAQRKKGRMTARERIEYFLDDGSFHEHSVLIGLEDGSPTDGIICGYGTVNGKKISVYSQDPTIRGGSVGVLSGYRMYKTVEKALQLGIPFVGLHDSPGARLPKLTESKTAIGMLMEKNGGSIFYPNTQGSGVIPQICGMLGSCAGLSVYSPALTDFIFMVDKQSHMYITGPAMVKTVTGEDLTHDELGGAEVHCTKSGVADGRFESEKALLDKLKELLGYLPQNADEQPPVVNTGDDPNRTVDELTDIVSSKSSKAYDVHKVIEVIADNGKFFEIKAEFAKEMVVGFARLDGKTVGIVANQPMVYAGSLTVDSSDKQTRFMRFCDCFNIPVVLLIDTPAYMPGSDQEHSGIIRHGAKVLYSLCEMSVPRISLVMRKSYGGGNLGMGTIPGMKTDMVYYWPIAEAGVLGAPASVELHFGKEIRASEDPQAMRAQKLEEYITQYANPMREASGNWSFEDVIEPRDTRKVLIRSLEYLSTKRQDITHRTIKKKHGNIPL
jgi:acetyl-CoA carboxylase carboxyltransferase component